MATSELVQSIQAGDRLVIFRPVQEPGGVTRYRAMRVAWDYVAGLLDAEAKARGEGDAAVARAVGSEAQIRGDQDKVLAERLKALEDTALRIETVAGAVKVAGTAVAVTFAKPFAAAPVLVPLPTWVGDQIVEAAAASVTASGATIMVKRSRGALLASSGPFENAPAGTAFAMLAIGAGR